MESYLNFEVFIAMEALIHQKMDFVEQLVLVFDPGRTAFSANDTREKTKFSCATELSSADKALRTS